MSRSNDHDATTTLELAKRDRKSTRLNSSHVEISYAVFCLKKKKKYISQDIEIMSRSNYWLNDFQYIVVNYFFFFNDTAATVIYTLSLHDALPISRSESGRGPRPRRDSGRR